MSFMKSVSFGKSQTCVCRDTDTEVPSFWTRCNITISFLSKALICLAFKKVLLWGSSLDNIWYIIHTYIHAHTCILAHTQLQKKTYMVFTSHINNIILYGNRNIHTEFVHHFKLLLVPLRQQNQRCSGYQLGQHLHSHSPVFMQCVSTSLCPFVKDISWIVCVSRLDVCGDRLLG